MNLADDDISTVNVTFSFVLLFFPPQLTYNIILASGLQRSRHLHDLGSDPPGKSGTHLTPDTVITVLLCSLCCALQPQA